MEPIYDLSAYPIIGSGGTKTAYAINNQVVIFRPNWLDGQSLINIWHRIIHEEIQMAELLTRIGIPTLKFVLCRIKIDPDQIITTISSQSFESEVPNGMYIIDTKNSRSSTWPTDKSLSIFSPDLDPFDVNNWLGVMATYIADVKTLVQNKIFLLGDSLNLAFVSKQSKFHSGSNLPFEVRIFGFDFASKHFTLDIKKLNPDTQIINRMLARGAEFAVWEEMCPDQIIMPKKVHVLYKELSTRMIDLYYSILV